MKKQLVTALALGTFLLPLGIAAVEANSFENNSTEGQTMELAQNSEHQRRKGNRRKGAHRDGMKRILSQLDLSSEQKQQIQAIDNKYESDRNPLYQELRTEHQEMKTLFTSNATPEELRTQHEKIRNLRGQMGDIRFSQMLEVREVLTPEQRDRMAELIANKIRERLPEASSTIR